MAEPKSPSLDSYIDIAVVVEHLNDNYFEDTPILWKLRRKVSNLIEPVLLTEDLNNPLYCDVAKTGISYGWVLIFKMREWIKLQV